MKTPIFLSLFLFLLLSPTPSHACTSAIVTGKVTSDGRPLLWKHRDTGQEQNRIEFITNGLYNFIALVDSPEPLGEAWIGTNQTGFSIMNTASYNIKDDNIKEMDHEGKLMFRALTICKTLSDFEFFLDTLKRPIRVEANFGVIDAHGGAAYYEVNNHSYTKLDVNDPKIAPLGYLIVTNFSYTGRFNDGMGYIRQQTAYELFAKEAPKCAITPLWIAQEASRSFYHSLLGIDLKKTDLLNSGTGWFIDQDFIPRKSTSASVIIQGVKVGEDPVMTTMWTMLGYPPATVMIPLWVAAGAQQPSILLSSVSSPNAQLCEWAIALKNRSFSIDRGNGYRYFNWPTIYNRHGSGYMQQLKPIEERIYQFFLPKIEQWRATNKIDLKDLSQSYSAITEWIVQKYKEI
ncbi:MAG: hypothetical protein LBC84_02515 [Prevotellaceae bacterium]|jgi:hypothetical protein|nr:hypothetical protein [Prevotellaceae bacterium]